MNPKMLVYAALFAGEFALLSPAAAFADDGAASIAAGGLVSRRETRIVMAKEVLRISPDKVVVDYDFRNDTAEDVKTEVAFPVPPYDWGPDGRAVNEASFSDFELFVDGKRVPFAIEAKAILKGKDVTAILTADKIDIPTFGHVRETDDRNASIRTPDLERLPKTEQNRLVSLGLFEPGERDRWGLWMVHLQYHWTQTFPAHSMVHIRHEYTPVEGFELMQLETLQNVLEHKQPTGDPETVKYEREDMQLAEEFCPDPSLLHGIIERAESDNPEAGQFAHPHWVDFILTTANTWKQPIEDFTLIVDRGKAIFENSHAVVSFCSPQNAPVEKLDAGHFQVHVTNFVPKDELHIGFFDVPEATPAPKP